MSAEEVIDLVEQYDHSSATNVKIKWESKDFINIDFNVKNVEGDWCNVNANVSKKAIKKIKDIFK